MFFLPKGEGRVMLEVSQGFWAGTHLALGRVLGWVPWWDTWWDGSHGPVVG